jgi:hypothetical protein
MMIDTEQTKNLIVVAAIDKYARMYNISNIETYDLFLRHDLLNILRNNYDTLHTQSLFEGALFADDYISRHAARI